MGNLLTTMQRVQSLLSLMLAPCVPKAMKEGSNTFCNKNNKYMGDGTDTGKKENNTTRIGAP